MLQLFFKYESFVLLSVFLFFRYNLKNLQNASKYRKLYKVNVSALNCYTGCVTSCYLFKVQKFEDDFFLCVHL